MKTTCDHIFVYGTLRPTLAPPRLRELIGQWRKVGDGFIAGRLYDLGEYPGAVLDSDDGRRIIGEVFRLPDDGATLDALDAYEEFDPENICASPFIRRIRQVTLEDGSKLDCWIYVYNGRVSTTTLIKSGDYMWRQTQVIRKGKRWKRKQNW